MGTTERRRAQHERSTRTAMEGMLLRQTWPTHGQCDLTEVDACHGGSVVGAVPRNDAPSQTWATLQNAVADGQVHANS